MPVSLGSIRAAIFPLFIGCHGNTVTNRITQGSPLGERAEFKEGGADERESDDRVINTMAKSRLCIGDPDAYASEMIKLINDKEFR